MNKFPYIVASFVLCLGTTITSWEKDMVMVRLIPKDTNKSYEFTLSIPDLTKRVDPATLEYQSLPNKGVTLTFDANKPPLLYTREKKNKSKVSVANDIPTRPSVYPLNNIKVQRITHLQIQPDELASVIPFNPEEARRRMSYSPNV